MRGLLRLLLFSVLIVGIAGATEYSLKDVEKIGGKIVKEIKKTMKRKLKKAKKSGGLEAMAEYCAENSFKDIEAIGEKYGIDLHVKRISFGNRNPKNAPKKDEEMMLKALDMMAKAGAFMPKTVVQAKEDGSFKLYAPLIMNSRACKKCHGDKAAIDPKIVNYFAKKYPQDRGYGFHSGDLRGAIVVEFPAPEDLE
ncbi:Tll0287-like domain-containing protein [Hydrogenimonas cancrithermarum]|uniref:Tll0287-like domain-containing protein n=1 Tax=Hydrogenimonas cancrithermarum TaxID=2993563 RepID=A0ABN6WVD0_9BACT|nr:DUF3365 domain-containing protein [Hydrogenimonas cancrithermarum]BDY12907.1 hypothetical protein HCR_12190 [Hydrogenimonas cancrithermarum]BDY13024.1 hypothetical protein HCR_13360 [Hydrogenimonas cancrithermarum]